MLVSELENRADRMISKAKIPKRIDMSKEFKAFQVSYE